VVGDRAVREWRAATPASAPEEPSLSERRDSAGSRRVPVPGILGRGRGSRTRRLEEIAMRILHTMIRVGDLERSIRFYTEALGMELLRKQDYPGGSFTLAFVEDPDGDRIEFIEKKDLGAGI
jgi:catechol-2,3-dioxygenase